MHCPLCNRDDRTVDHGPELGVDGYALWCSRCDHWFNRQDARKALAKRLAESAIAPSSPVVSIALTFGWGSSLIAIFAGLNVGLSFLCGVVVGLVTVFVLAAMDKGTQNEGTADE